MKRLFLFLVLCVNTVAQSVVSTTVPVNTNMVLLGKGTNFFNVNSNLFATTARNYVGLPNMAALRALPITYLANGAGVNVLGYYSPGDGGGATYILTNTISGTNAYGGLILAAGGTKSWLSLSSESNVREYGAKGDGVTDDTASIQAAWNDRRGRVVRVPSSMSAYALNSPLLLVNSSTDRSMGFRGDLAADSKGGTIFKINHTNAAAITFDGPGIDIANFTVDYFTRPANTQTNAVGLAFRNCWNGSVRNIAVFDAAKAIRFEPGYAQFSLNFEDISVYGYSVGGLHLQGSGAPFVSFKRVDIRNSGNPFSSTATASNVGTNVTVAGLSSAFAAQLRTNTVIRVSGLSPSEFNGFFTCYSPNGVDGFTYLLAAPPSGSVTGTATVECYTGLSTLEAIRVESGQQTSWSDIAVEWAGTTRAVSFNEYTIMDGFHFEGFCGQVGGSVALRFAEGADIRGMDFINSALPPGLTYALFEVPAGQFVNVNILSYKDLQFTGSTMALRTGDGIINMPFMRQETSERWDRQSTPGAEIQTTLNPGVTNAISQVFPPAITNNSIRFFPSIGGNRQWRQTGSGATVVDNLTGTTNQWMTFQEGHSAAQTAGLYIFPTGVSSWSSVKFPPSVSDRSLWLSAGVIQSKFNSTDGERLLYLNPTNTSQGVIMGTNSGTYNYLAFAPSASTDRGMVVNGATINTYQTSTGAAVATILNPGETTQIGNNTSGEGLQVSASGSVYRLIRSGTATAVNGIVQVNDANVLSTSELIFTRVNKNASTALGVSYDTVITNAASFTITILKTDTTTETGDQSTIKWLMLNK